MERIKITNRKGRVSWGSIIGGVFTVFAISILLSILATSIGLFQFDPTSNHPASGIGATVGIFTVLSLLISMAAGGFVAGKLAGADGMIHGFLVWATALFITVFLVASLAMGTVRMAGNILGSVASVTGNVLSGVGTAVSNVAGDAEGVFGNIDFSGNIDRAEVRQDVRQALRRSGVREFQPEYIERQMKGIKADFDKSVRKLVTNPNDADKVINQFLERVKTRTENAFKDIDRNDLTRAIANNTNLSRAEVDRAVDEYIELYNNAVAQGREQIENLQESVQQAREDWEVTKQNALTEADRVANAAGRGALWSFFALLIGAVLSSFIGYLGTRTTKEGVEV